ncbi:hypothetical protein GLOIN_2v1780244 [Rhizophagus irregularis DAOM 181602=DAOM 197198]|nr:hypothetical protein GLOIN_2v1780244 [Rhizophagus irregularis DAOM 181602=DAOM 197198]
MLYLFVTAYENGISLVKSVVVGIKESRNFEDLLKEALSNELFLEDKLAQHVRFTISHSILIPDELSNEGSSAFNFMMTQQRLKKLPPLYNSQFRNDLLYNDFLKILQERKLGWLNDNHLTIGHSFIRRVTNLVCFNLSIQQPWTRLLHWEEVIKDIDDLIKIAQEYANYLQGINNRMCTIHTSRVPVRNGWDDITVEDIEAVDLYPSQYEFLAQLLRESNDYDLLNIDHLLPPKPQNIYLFFQNICADVSFTLYRYYHGNYLGTLNFYSLIVKASRSILQVLYKDLTGDVSTSDNEINKKTHERIKLMLDTQDPDIIIDLCKIINEKGTKFDVFWNEMQDYFNEVMPAVHDRRYTSTLYMPIAISVKDLVQIIIERLENKYGTIPNDIEIPSTEWVRLQFWLKTEFSENRYTGRFQIRYMIQARQIRKSHINSHYCSALWRYLLATSTGVRNKSALTTIDGILNSCDHDFTKLSLTPSASLFVDISNSISDSFYQGQVYIAYKDTIFQPSSAIRHAIEFYNNYSIQYQDNINKPKILLLYTNGGPDHRCTYGSVQISLIALFLKGNFDFLAAVRTAPYHSWANPAECIMSILSLALQDVALKREDMKELIKSIKITQEFLENRISRLSLHDLKFKITSPAIETEIDSLFEEFIDTHCQIRQYSFQIKKCNNSECTICLPVELPIEVFDELHFLPDPEPSIADSNHYKDFSSIYGTQTSENFRPSKAEQLEADNLPQGIFNNNRVREFVECDFCGKIRCIYSMSALKKEQISTLQLKINDNDFTCVIEEWMPPSHELKGIVFIHQSLSCDSPIESGYYSNRLKKPSICYYCGKNNSLVKATNDLLHGYQSVYPLCSNCQLSGHSFYTWGKKKVGELTRKRKRE